MNFRDLKTEAKIRAMNWYRIEWDIFGECESWDDVIYSLKHGDFSFTEDGEYIEE